MNNRKTIFVSPLFLAKDFEPEIEELSFEDEKFLDSAEKEKYAQR